MAINFDTKQVLTDVINAMGLIKTTVININAKYLLTESINVIGPLQTTAMFYQDVRFNPVNCIYYSQYWKFDMATIAPIWE